MPRKPRSARHAPDACYHVPGRGHAREPLSHDPDDFTPFHDLLAREPESAPAGVAAHRGVERPGARAAGRAAARGRLATIPKIGGRKTRGAPSSPRGSSP